MAGHPGPQSPNNSEAVDWENTTQVCGRTPATGCLYDVFSDPGEDNNQAAREPQVYTEMMAAIAQLEKGVFSPHRRLILPNFSVLARACLWCLGARMWRVNLPACV